MAIYGPARLGTMRLGAFRLGYVPATGLKILIGGVDHTAHVRLASLTITDELNHEPNNASFRVDNVTPVAGQAVSIVLGGQQLFGGVILSRQSLYEELPTNLAWDVHCIDYTWLLNRRPVLKKYMNQSASAILIDLIANFTAGVTAAHVEAGLPVIDEITFTNENVDTALSRVMERIGGYWFLDYTPDLHAFTTFEETAGAITQAAPRTMVDIQEGEDLSQVATRVVARGGGSNTAGDIGVGFGSMPVEDASWYAPGGGVVEAGPQRIAYTGAALGGAGSIAIGATTVAAPTAPTAALNAAAGNVRGVVTYKSTFVIAGGETLPSTASGSVTGGTVTPDASGLGFTATSTGLIPPGTVVRYRVSFVSGSGEGPAGRPSAAFTIGSGGLAALSSVPTGPGGTTARRIYRSDNGGAYGLAQTISNNTATSINDGDDVLDSPPIEAGSLVDVTGIAVGPAGTTARRLYRTAAGGSVYLLVGTIADNTTTTFADDVADASLGNPAPTVSTVPALAGDTVLPVAELAVFPASGWVRIGAQLVGYTGRSGSSGPGTLTGIPNNGVGALLAPVSFGAEVIVAPHLAGTTGVLYALNKGDQVNLVVTVNDAAAQAVMIARVGGDGIHEYPISDGRWSAVEATARATAELTKRKNPLRSISFDSHDPTLFSGRSITITLTSPAITGTFTIQRVTFSEIGVAQKPTWPLRRVECSSTRYSFEDLLRQIKEAA